MSDFARETFEWIEIDQDFCAEEYSVGACMATLETGGTECYNTRASCQYAAAYDRSTLTLRFCKNQAFIPDDYYYIPSLESVQLSAGSINPVGANANSSALGTRGGISVSLRDHPHTDRYVDPYIDTRHARDITYIATERGTFWTKWRARNPYYLGRVIRHKIGYVENRQVVDVVTRTYFITGFDGPSGSGSVSISGKDLLSQVSNEKAKAPFASTGKLLNDCEYPHTHCTLDPVGIGDEEYPASGIVRIGTELIAFTRSGDVLTLTRAQYNTTAQDHKAGAVVQLCLNFSAQTPADILEELLTTYAGIPSGYLNTAQWAAEQTDYMPRLYGALITSPTGVMELIAEMCEQMYFYPIWDERNAQLNIRAIRPAEDDTVHELSDFRNFVADSVVLRDLTDQLVTQVWVYYGLINPTESATDDKNYAAREILLTDESTPEKHGTEKIKKLYCRWIPSTNGAAAVDLGEKMVARYGAVPRQVTFSMTGKDSSIWLGDFCRVEHRLSVDMTGQSLPLNIQILSAQESKPGIEYRYVGQEFVYEAPANPDDRLIIISADQTNINLRTLHDSLYTAPTGGEIVRVVVRAGVTIGGIASPSKRGYISKYTYMDGISIPTNPLVSQAVVTESFYQTLDPAFGGIGVMQNDCWVVPAVTSFDTGTWPSDVTLLMTIEAGAGILGQGGDATAHGALVPFSSSGNTAFANDGGHAMRVQHPISIINYGIIAGGGGGGYPLLRTGGTAYLIMPGGGGAGYSISSSIEVYHGSLSVIDTFPSVGSFTDYGYGGAMHYTGTGQLAGLGTLRSTNGGALATAAPTNLSEIYTPFILVGGNPGKAIISGASMVTWTNKGDVRGAEVA